jgi:hypothetical protein
LRSNGRVRVLALHTAVALSFFLAAPAARAEDAAACYDASWAGVPAAELRLAVHDGPDGYRNEIEIRTLGLARWATKFNGNATGAGRLAAEHLPAPQTYDAHYDLRKRKHRILNLHFVQENGALVAERQPDDTSRKPPLDEKYRRDVLDPLAVLAAIRQRLKEHRDAGFTIPAYDDARRFDVVTRAPPRRENGVIHLALTLHAIAGFKGESSDDGDPDDAPRPVALTLSDDGRLMPLKMRVPIWYLPLSVSLERVCSVDQPCTW